MGQRAGIRETFVVSILNDQNSTWQGTVMWVDEKKTQPFRSTLELIRLIGSAVDATNEDEAGGLLPM